MKATRCAIFLSWFFVVVILQGGLITPTRAAPPEPQKINLNQASAKSLVHSIRGIGKIRAEAIVKYREEHGAFKTIEELSYVRGLGKGFVNKHREQLAAVFILH